MKTNKELGWNLSDNPGEWVEIDGSYRQRWLPGAFGDLRTLTGEFRFKVEEDEWETKEDGTVWRTIKKAKVFDEGLTPIETEPGP